MFFTPGILLKLRKICMFVCASLTLIYLCALCVANPSKELLFALFIELSSFGAYIFFAWRRSKTAGAQAGEAVISELSKQFTLVHKLRRGALWCSVLFWFTAAICLTIDCFAFMAAFAGQNALSLAVYRAVPFTRVIGLHPGASLEVLTGAYREAGKYREAMPLYEEVMQLRLQTFGPVHEEIAALYCDFGDLYGHQNQLQKAEGYYRKGLEISIKVLGDKGSGRAYTRLANCLRDQGRYDEATAQYQNAYDMRVHEFGANSSKVAETLADWVKLCRLQGLNAEADRMQLRVNALTKNENKADPFAGAIFSLIIFALSLFVSNLFLGRKGILTEMVVNRMRAAADANATGGPQAPEISAKQLARLVTLCRFQKKYAEADRYNEMLTALTSKGG